MSGIKDLNHYYYLENILKNINYDLPNQNFKNPSSLESIGAIDVAILLWRRKDVVDMLENELENVDQIIDKVLEKVSHLEITHNCKREVKEVIPRIGKIIKSFFDLQERHEEPQIDFKMYWNNLHFNQNGNIDINKTFKRIIEYSNLDEINKFYLACNNCFIDKIKELHVKLPESFVNDIILNAPLFLGIGENGHFSYDINYYFNYQKPHALILFWLFKFRGKQEEFPIIIDRVAINEYLLRWAIYHRYENAVKYIFENFTDEALETKLVDITHFATKLSDTFNIVLYLFNRMSLAQFEEACVKMGFDFLKFYLLSTGKCDSFASAVKYVLKFIKIMNFRGAFRIIVLCWQKELFQKDRYIYMWNEIANMSTVEINENYEIIFFELFYLLLLTENDIESTKLLLNMGPSRAKEYIFRHWDEEWMIESFIIQKRLDLFDLLINQMLPDEEEILIFRRSFFSCFGVDISSDLINMDDFNLMEDLMNRFCDDIIVFKRELPYIKSYIVLRNILLSVTVHDGKQLKLINKFLNWSFDGDEEEINVYMSNFIISKINDLGDIISLFLIQIDELINFREWELVGKYLKLIFSASVKNISFTKDKLKHINIMCTKILNLPSNGRNRNLMEIFIKSCFEPENFYLLLEELRTFEKPNVMDQD